MDLTVSPSSLQLQRDAHAALVVCLAGNPNVGKSSLFNALTGEACETAHCAGVTAQPAGSCCEWEGRAVQIVDLPGAYTLEGSDPAHTAVREALRDIEPDVVVVVVDATNLARNLYLVLQLLDLGHEVVVALNLVDEARRRGVDVDAPRLQRELGVPVVRTVASRGEGAAGLRRAVLAVADGTWPAGERAAAGARRYGPAVEGLIGELGARLEPALGHGPGGRPEPRRDRLGDVRGGSPGGRRRRRRGRRGRPDTSARRGAAAAGGGAHGPGHGRRRRRGPPTARAAAFGLLEGAAAPAGDDLAADLAALAHTPLPEAGEEAPQAFAALRDDDDALPVLIARERLVLAARIAAGCLHTPRPHAPGAVWRATTSPVTGLPILAGVIAAVFAVLFVVGDLLSRLLTGLWESFASPAIVRAVEAVLGDGTLGRIVLWGIDGGVLATLAVGIPYILTFYVLLALLEDSGYLNAAAFLTDRVLHRFGLHGRAVIPLIAALGCNVPAVIGTRSLRSARERLIASVLITLTPCSARTAVIIGAVALYAGWQWAVAVYGVLILVGVGAGLALNRVLPGRHEPLVMEMFPFRRPAVRQVARKTWRRFREFVWDAAPIIVLGSMALGALYETGAIWELTAPLAPVVEWWLMLPPVAGLTLLFAVLRKELALQLLLTFAVVAYGASAQDISSFMNDSQIVTYALVNAIYVPCIATIAVLGREIGWRSTGLVCASTVALAVLVGGIAARLAPLLGA